MCWKQLLDYFLLRAAMGLCTELGTTCAWSETKVQKSKCIQKSLLGKVQHCCLWVLQAREHGQFPWELWESLCLIAAESTSSKPTFPVLSLTGIWRSLALWCGMAVAFPVPRLSWVRAGRENANPQWAHLAGSSQCPLGDQHRGQRFLTSEVKRNQKLGQSMKVPVTCTQTNPQRQISAQGTNLGGGSRPWSTRRYQRISASMPRALSHGWGTVICCSQTFWELGL